jgi:alpha-ketoglutarate-dependent taurine dioxygenase
MHLAVSSGGRQDINAPATSLKVTRSMTLSETIAGHGSALPVAFLPGALGGSLAAVDVADARSGSDLVALVNRYRSELRDTLYARGALLFRGFAVADAATFEAVTRAFSPTPFSYVGGATPRSRISGEVFTSTEYSADAHLPLHNEASYLKTLPEFAWFFCKLAPQIAGETPLADMRQVLKNLDPALVTRFDERGLAYLNNLHGGGGFGKSWQQTYQSEDKAEVEERIREKESEFEWTTDGALRVIMRAPALRTHPVTGRTYWGNQVANWHPAMLPATTQTALQRLYRDPMNYPKNVFFGDGSTIADDDARQIAQALVDAETTFSWQAGDVLLVDNQAIAHGRRPFKGERQIMVALS